MQLIYPEKNTRTTSVLPYLAARLLSDIANPLFIPPLVLILMGWTGQISAAEFRWITGLAVVFYSVIPLAAALYLLHIGHIHSLDLPDQKSRGRLFIYSILSFSAGSLSLLFYFNITHPFLAVSAVVFLLNPIIGFMLNKKWKISIHTAALASAGTIFLCQYILPIQIEKTTAGILSLTILLVLLPLMIWARYYLRMHSIPELIGGILAGIMCTWIEISIMLKIW